MLRYITVENGIIHNTLLKSRSILCFFCSTKNSYQLLEKSHLLLYKAKIETIHPKSLIITFAMKPLYLKHIYKLLKSFFFLSTRFLDYRSHALYIFYQFHVLDFAKFRLQYVRYPVVRQLYNRKYSKCRLCSAFFMSNFLFILLYGCCTAL